MSGTSRKVDRAGVHRAGRSPGCCWRRALRARASVLLAACGSSSSSSSSTASSSTSASASSSSGRGIERVAHPGHEGLHRGVHPRPAVQAGARGQGLQDQLQGEHRRHRDRRQGADQRADRRLPGVHGRVRRDRREDQQDRDEPAGGVQPREGVLRQARPGDERHDAVLRHRRDRGQEGVSPRSTASSRPRTSRRSRTSRSARGPSSSIARRGPPG